MTAAMSRIHVKRIPLSRQGYTRRGEYYGAGLPLYCGHVELPGGECLLLDDYFRAPDRAAAVAIMRTRLASL